MLQEKISSRIVTIGSPILTSQAEYVNNISSETTQALIAHMFTVMSKENGVGLAAPQIGIKKQIAVIHTQNTRLVLINPIITHRSDDFVVSKEGCLSVPNQELQIFRHHKITIHYFNEDGKKMKMKAHDFLAIVCQHEIDHLHGILMTDRYAQQKHLREKYNIS